MKSVVANFVLFLAGCVVIVTFIFCMMVTFTFGNIISEDGHTFNGGILVFFLTMPWLLPTLFGIGYSIKWAWKTTSLGLIKRFRD